MQQPSMNAEILGIWGVFSLDSGRWISSNGAVESSILDMLRLHPTYRVKSKLSTVASGCSWQNEATTAHMPYTCHFH